MPTEELLYAHIGNLTKSRDPKTGYLRIKGIATDDSLDLDGQRCDPEWLKGAMSDWFKTGNLREMHQMSAVGKADKLTQKGTGFEIEALIVDPLAAEKFETGVYGYLSIGIKGARIDRSEKALETTTDGWIRGGKIVEVSGCDIGSNQNAKAGPVELVKTVGDITERTEVLGSLEDLEKADNVKGDCETCDGTGKIKGGSTKCPDCDGTGKAPDREGQGKSLDAEIEELTAKLAAAELQKRQFTDAERKEAASTGAAMPGGGFPIKTVADLKNAIQAIGRAKDPAAAKAHIKRRAHSLGKDSLIPDNWKAPSTDEMTHDPAQIQEISDGLGELMIAEITEMMNGENEVSDLYQLLQSWQLLLCWWGGEANEGETTPPFTGDDMNLSTVADLVKAGVIDTATDEDKAAVTELRKALGLEEIATKAEFEALQETIKGLEAGFADVREMAAPGQPALRGSLEDQRKAAQVDELTIKAQHYRATANSATNPETARQYSDAADELEKRLRELST